MQIFALDRTPEPPSPRLAIQFGDLLLCTRCAPALKYGLRPADVGGQCRVCGHPVAVLP